MNDNFLKNIIDNINECICVIGCDGNIIFCSEQTCRYFNINIYNVNNYSDMPSEYTELSSYENCMELRDKVKKSTQLDNNTLVTAYSIPIFDTDKNMIYCIEELSFSSTENHTSGVIVTKGNTPSNLHSNAQIQNFDELVISDNAMFEINQTISRIAYFDPTILIQGETGTGKTALARHIHKNSNRADKPFVTINCGAIPENLIESELFGYASGAFTSANKKGKPGRVELADGGTLFLDEIGLLPYNLQGKFLQLIQEKTYTPVGALKSKTVDVRIIAATNENLKNFIKEKKFREDLYYRLRVIEFFIPPLRERKDAIELLTKHFLEKYNTKFGKNKTITSTALSTLKAYDWPGNIRELQYVIERIIITSDSDTITSEDIPPLQDMESNIKASSETNAHAEQEEAFTIRGMQNFDSAIAEFEKKILTKAYKEHRSSYKVADALGITQTKASRLLRKYHISS